MPWVVSRNTDKELAHYVDVEMALRFRIAIARQDALTKPDGCRQVTEAIYNALSKRKISYALEPHNADTRIQQIRPPERVLGGAREGTCLDLALLFGGIALGKDLAPLVIMLEGHALAAVSLDDDRTTAIDMPRRNREGPWLDEGLLHDGDVLRNLIDKGHYVAVECTGFAKGTVFQPGMPESADRVGGKLAFCSAVRAGRKQLDLQNERPFRFAIDLAVLRDRHGYAMFGLSGSAEQKLIANMDARAETAGLQRRVIVSLARGQKRDVSGFDQAVGELKRAVEVVRDVIARGERGTNADEFVDKVLSEIAEKTKNADFDGSARAVNDALAELDRREAEQRKREAEQRDTARRARVELLEAGVRQDTLRRDAVAVAGRIAALVTVQHPTERPAWLPEFRKHYETFCEEGRDKGINFSLSVAVELARRALATARNNIERGEAADLLSSALTSLQEGQSGTAWVEEAVGVSRTALEETPRDQAPLQWARTQCDLGDALTSLFERAGASGRLKEAVAAYRAALEETPRERAPDDWASTQDRLGGALRLLGDLEDEPARLKEAIAAYRAALEEMPRDREPLRWSITQQNLGTALAALGEHERGTARLKEAIAAYRAALEERAPDKVPLKWALTQSNLGAALLSLGRRERGTKRLEEAVAAYRAALEKAIEHCDAQGLRPHERVHPSWVSTQEGLAEALADLAWRLKDADRMKEALTWMDRALEVSQRLESPSTGWIKLEILGIQDQLAVIKSDQSGQGHGRDRITPATQRRR